MYMDAYMYVYVCTCMYVLTYMLMYEYMYIYIYIYMCVCVTVSVCVYSKLYLDGYRLLTVRTRTGFRVLSPTGISCRGHYNLIAQPTSPCYILHRYQ